MKARSPWRATLVLSGAALVASGCGERPGASPVAPSVEVAAPKVLAIVGQNELLIRADGLENAQQVEGIIRWLPDSVWYESFNGGTWWFSTPEWEWLILPNRGEMMFGVWRSERLSGNGVIGRIQFQGKFEIQALGVWVDGERVTTDWEDRRADTPTLAGLMPSSNATRSAQGTKIPDAWFVIPGGGR